MALEPQLPKVVRRSPMYNFSHLCKYLHLHFLYKFLSEKFSYNKNKYINLHVCNLDLVLIEFYILIIHYKYNM